MASSYALAKGDLSKGKSKSDFMKGKAVTVEGGGKTHTSDPFGGKPKGASKSSHIGKSSDPNHDSIVDVSYKGAKGKPDISSGYTKGKTDPTKGYKGHGDMKGKSSGVDVGKSSGKSTGPADEKTGTKGDHAKGYHSSKSGDFSKGKTEYAKGKNNTDYVKGKTDVTKGYNKGSTEEMGKGKAKCGVVGNSCGNDGKGHVDQTSGNDNTETMGDHASGYNTKGYGKTEYAKGKNNTDFVKGKTDVTKGYNKGSTEEMGKGKTKCGDVGSSCDESIGKEKGHVDQNSGNDDTETKGNHITKGYHSKSGDFSKGKTEYAKGKNNPDYAKGKTDVTKGYKGSTDEMGKGKSKCGNVGKCSGKSSGSADTEANQDKMGYHSKGYKGYSSKSGDFSKGKTEYAKGKNNMDYAKGKTDVTKGYKGSTDETGKGKTNVGDDGPTSSGSKGSATETWDHTPPILTTQRTVYSCDLGDRVPYRIYVPIPNCFTRYNHTSL